MKKINVLLFTTLLLTSCMPAANLSPTLTPKPLQTATFTTTSTSTFTPTATAIPLPIVFIYSDDIPAKWRTLQEQAAYKAYTNYSQYADLGPITVYTFKDVNKYIDQIFPSIQADVPTLTKSGFVQEWIEGGGGNISAQDIVALSSSLPAWRDEGNRCYKAKNIAGEMFHTLQSRLIHHGLFRPALDYGPEWLREGSAEVFGNKIADGLNDCTYSNELASWLKNSTTANYPLKEVDSGNFARKMQFWSLAPYAVDTLIKLTPEGEQSVINYYVEIGNGKSWKNAFQSAFGISIEEFYNIFESNRTKGEIDASVCTTQTDVHVKCLGRKPNKDFIFEIPFIVTTQANEWKVKSECEVTGWGLEGSNDLQILQISVWNNTHGACQVKVTFSTNQQMIVNFFVP